MSYNIDQQTREHFEFTIGGHDYLMRYPTTEEISSASSLVDDKGEMDVSKVGDWLMSFVEGAKPDTPPISETLNKVNLNALKHFRVMLKVEIGLE